MGLFDRFTSQKGKDQKTGPKHGMVKDKVTDKAKDEEKKIFAAVPGVGGKAPKTVDQAKPQEETKPNKKDEKKPAKPVSAAKSDDTREAYRILLRPVITEKTTRGGQYSQYTFEINQQASKAAVAQSIYHLYGVKPVAVNVVSLAGRAVRFGRHYGRTNRRKKAIVTLPAGKTIDVVSA